MPNESIAGMGNLTSHFEELWKNSQTISWGLVISAMCLALWATYYPQAPGISIGMLGLVAGIMSLRPEMHVYEKMAWILILIAFAVLEVRAIHKTDEDNRQTRDAQNQKFDLIANGITDSYHLSQQQFAATMGRSDKILGQVKETIKTYTGADTYCVAMVQSDTAPSLVLNLWIYGKYPMYDVDIRFMDIDLFQKLASSAQSETRYHFDALKQGGQLMTLNVTGKEHTYRAVISARNGDWEEFIKVRKLTFPTGGAYWATAMRLYKTHPGKRTDMNAKPLFEYIDENYPKGEIDWTETKPQP
jgi:hypothetical protein